MTTRRLQLKMLALVPIAQITACSNTNEVKIVNLDHQRVKNFNDLIREIKLSIGKRSTDNSNDQEIYSILADSFVKHAQEAINLGTKIPEDILNKLPLKRKTVAPALAVPAMMFFTISNVQFMIPIALFFDIILGSLGVMLIFILTAINSFTSKDKKNT